jgi:hypothetical protein
VRPTPDAGHDATPGPDAGPDTGNEAGPDAPADATQSGPAFGGVTSVSPASATSLLVTWDPATDPATTPEEMTYAVYVATSSHGEVYSAAGAYQLLGQTSYTVQGLVTGTQYYVVVRARNKAGIEETNVQELSATPTADTNPPSFKGPVTAVPLPGCHAGLSWPAATDDLTATPGLRYAVYFADNVNGGDAGAPLLTTGYGVTSVTLAVPQPTTSPYHQFLVVALDAAGNVSANGLIGDTSGPIQFSQSIQTLVEYSCAPSCHTLNTTNKLKPVFDDNYAYQSLTAGGAGVGARVCRPGSTGICPLDAGECPAWQLPEGGPVELVVPSMPECSVFFQVLNQGKMPPTGVQPVTACDVQMVHDWIEQGAQNN